MKVLKKLAKIVLDLIIVLMLVMIVIVAYNFFQINVFNHKYSNLFGYTLFEVSTGSMSGTLEINDVILVQITQEVKQNDIITYEENEEIITHRIIKEDGNTLYTKGDANNAEDKPINRNSVIGKVVKVFPKFGIWIKVISDTKVIISVIITIALFGIAFSIESKKDEEEKHVTFYKFMRSRRERKDEEKQKKKE